MKKIGKVKFLGVIFSFLILSACQSDEWNTTDSGGFLISLNDAVVGVETKSTPKELGKPVKDKFSLEIIKQSTGASIYKGGYTSETIKTSAGKYDITATYGENPELALDNPYYKGDTTDIEVKNGETTSVSLSCKVANALASVSYANKEAFEELFSEYYLDVKVGKYTVSIDDTTKSAYYRADSEPVFSFRGKLKSGKEVVKTLESEDFKDPTTFAAGSHCILKLNVDTTASGVILTLQAAEVKEETISETIPLEWLPKPTITSDGFVNNILDVYETESPAASIKLNIAHELQDLKFALDFEDEKLKAYNKEYILSELSDQDRLSLKDLGLSLPLLKEKTPSIEITSKLTSKLLAKDDGDVVNKIILSEVKSNDRVSDRATFQILTHKPEFSVSVLAGNIWTKEFTIEELSVSEGKGKSDIIAGNIRYQYSDDDGETWMDCNDNRRQAFSDHPAQKSYKVRALYREELSSATVDLELESPEQLPNSDMDAWSDEEYKSSYYSFMPWNSSVNHFWDTNNLFTTRHRNNADINVANYNGFHSISYTKGRGENGYAAEIRSTANGRGNTRAFSLHTEQSYNKVSGELFTGTSKVTMGTSGFVGDADGSKDIYERIKDAEHLFRPTALHFYYKYTPYNTDTWKAHIELLDANKNVIVENEIQASDATSDWTEGQIELNYDVNKLYPKCKYIFVIFYSTIKGGKDMPYREITQTFYVENETKTFKPAYVGSVLTIDDISLVYDK